MTLEDETCPAELGGTRCMETTWPHPGRPHWGWSDEAPGLIDEWDDDA